MCRPPGIFWVGLDVHKDALTVAVFRAGARDPLVVDRIPGHPMCIRR
jgi:hypothetical protein